MYKRTRKKIPSGAVSLRFRGRVSIFGVLARIFPEKFFLTAQVETFGLWLKCHNFLPGFRPLKNLAVMPVLTRIGLNIRIRKMGRGLKFRHPFLRMTKGR